MESDINTGTESDFSDWDPACAALTSENSEDSDDLGIYYGDNQMYDTVIGGSSDGSYGSGNRGSSGSGVQFDRHKLMSQLNSSHADSAYSGSGNLYPIHEFSSNNSSGSEVEDETVVATSHSPRHRDAPVYGRYQKLSNQASEGDREVPRPSERCVEYLTLHRLPGENLGMILGIEDGSGNVLTVSVKSVTLGGAAFRATGSSKGICVGDDIIQVNGIDLQTLTHDECVQVFKDMPLRVLLGIRRGKKDLPPVSISPAPTAENRLSVKKQRLQPSQGGKQPSKQAKSGPPRVPPKPIQITRRKDISDSEDDGFDGFAMYNVIVEKDGQRNLGLSIVPSYGSTKEYYQIKRILPSGAAAHSGKLEVGDRLISCNGASLRGLSQTHCLDIIKAASGLGDVNFEVIRPVYHGNSMEISVTVNNGVNNSRTFDPSQYSVKSQSYDSHGIDVVVTSESEDCLTVSEDEYSRTGRLANIPESEANQVFVSNSVRLAYQQDLNAIDQDSTETDTDPTQLSDRTSYQRPPEDIEIVDLNRINTSPYHIPHKNIENTKVKQRLNQAATKLKSDSNSLVHRSNEPDQIVPIKASKISNQRHIPQSDLDQVSPRTPIPSSNLDQALDSRSYQSSPRSNQSSPRSPTAIPRSNLDNLGSRSPVPNSDLDNISLTNSYRKRQQVPSDSELNVPYNYPPGYIDEEIPVSDTEATRYNPLYEDSNLSEFTDSDVQDIYIASPCCSPTSHLSATDLDRVSLGSNRTLTRTDLDAISVGSDLGKGDSDTAVPPPDAFSDNTGDVNELDADNYTGNIVPESPRFSELEAETIARSLHDIYDFEDDEVDTDSENHPEEELTDESDLDDAKLAFSTELTAPFDIVLQEQGIGLETTPTEPEVVCDFDQSENDILQVVTGYNDGTVVISQFEPGEEVEPIEEAITPAPNYIVTRFSPTVRTPDTAMDHNSENMLKDALDMEYEHMAESSKYEARLKLANGDSGIPNNIENGLDDPSFDPNMNVVAENIAKDMAKAENGGIGYYMESDDEPDSFPEADAPEANAPALPDMPPPPMWGSDSDNVVTINGQPVSSESDDLTEVSDDIGDTNIVMDDNWSFKTKPVKHDGDGEVCDEVITPMKIQRKVEIPVKFVQQDKSDEDDIIIPESIKRVFQLPQDFKERQASPRENKQSIDNEDMFSTRQSKKLVTNLQISDVNKENEPEIEEEVIKPQNALKDHAKNLVNVISVVNALKASAKHIDPDELDLIQKEDAKDKPKALLNAVIKVGRASNSSSKKDAPQASPPKVEQVVTASDSISISNVTKPQQPESKVTDIKESHGAKVQAKPTHTSSAPEIKTCINVEKPHVTGDRGTDTAANASPVPPLNLESVTSNSNDSVSPKSDKSGGSDSPGASYKTTIGVTKQQPSSKLPGTEVNTLTKPDSKPSVYKSTVNTGAKAATLPRAPLSKPLSQIKPLSFNPKSLSQSGSRPQYKTTISALGGKPGGLSSISKPLAGSVKPDHPIKRMETIPFEVSILKGILGIGIKTVMTPEGHVKVTEILPTGPVGREGNIKVGDYILSINNTELTGQTDGKVQQILRLLPRGLSKIVASAVPPGQTADQTEPASTDKPQLMARQSLPPAASSVKPQLSPGQSSPLSSPRQPTVTTNPHAVTVLSHQPPVPVPRAIPSTTTHNEAPALPKSAQPPVIAPRSLNVTSMSDSRSPNLLPRSPTASPRSRSPTAAPRSISPQPAVRPRSRSPNLNVKPAVSPRSRSPIVSPRSPVVNAAPAVISPRDDQLSPRTPPPIAPKPKRSPTKETSLRIEDPNAPIEAEIFVSVNASKRNTVPTMNILPGSVTYDTVQSVNKTGWVPGVVSSGDIKKGKTDVVADTESQDVNVEHTVDITAPSTDYSTVSTDCKDSREDTVNVIGETSDHGVNTTSDQICHESNIVQDDMVSVDVKRDSSIDAIEKLSGLEKDLEDSQNESSVLNRPRKFSTSSTGSSYAEFRECDVDDQIDELQESPRETVEDDNVEVVAEVNGVESHDSNYDSDFEEDHDDALGNGVDSEKLQSLAENIVSSVISSAKKTYVKETAGKEDDVQEAPAVPALPSSPPPDSDNLASEAETKAAPPAIPTEAPPPLPHSTAPAFDATPATVVDLALYPDSDQGSEDNLDKNHQETINQEAIQQPETQQEVVSVVEASVSSNLHAESPVVDIVCVSQNPEHVDHDKTVPDNVDDSNESSFQLGTGNARSTDDSCVLQNGGDAVTPPVQDNEISVQITNGEETMVNDVISMYSNLESSWNAEKTNTVEETNNNEYKLPVNSDVLTGDKVMVSLDIHANRSVDGTESCDDYSTRSIAGSDDYRLDANFSEAGDLDIKETDELEPENVDNCESVIPDSSTEYAGDNVTRNVFDNTDNTVNGTRNVPVAYNGGSNGVKAPTADVVVAESSPEVREPISRPKSVSRVDDILSQAEEAGRGKYSPELDRIIRLMSETEEPQPEGEGEMIDITLNKGVTGLGFLIQGGKSTPKGDLPLAIKRIFKGGPADGLLQVRDEICEVNGEDMSDMRHSEAWNHLKFLPSGDLVMKIRRFTNDATNV